MAVSSSIVGVLMQWLEEKQALFSLHPFTLSFLIIIFLFSVFYLFRQLHYGTSSKELLNLPPSPPKLPIIGNIHQMGTLLHRSVHEAAKTYGPLMLLQLGQLPTLIVSSVEMAAEVMKNQDIIFANRTQTTAAKKFVYGCIDIGFSPYGEYYRQIKKICVQELWSIKSVQSVRYVREEEVDIVVKKLTDKAAQGVAVNISELLLTLTNNVICRCAFGDKYEGFYELKFGGLSREIMKLMVAFSFGDYFPSIAWMDNFTGFSRKVDRIALVLDIFFNQVIKEHLHDISKWQDLDEHEQEVEKKKLDLIGILLLAQKDHTYLGNDNIKAIIMDMFIGGSATSSTAIEWAMAELIKNPKVLKKAQDEVRRVVGKKSKVEEDDINQMEFLKCIVKETLRLHPSIPTMAPRWNFKSTKIQGYDIPKGTMVLINAWSIHRDPKYWDSPEEFRPERFINSSLDFKGQEFHYFPFGSGRRGCPGTSFGVAVVELVLANFLYWFDWKLPGGAKGEELDMTEAYNFTVHRKDTLHLIPKLHSAANH